MKKLKAIVIGYGFLGKWHAQKAAALTDLCELVAIIETFSANQALARQNHPGIPVVEDWREIQDQFEAAVVVTPTSFHYSIARDLLIADKHVFCEKPLCSTSKEAQELIELSHQRGVLLQVGHSERCHAAWETIRPQILELSSPLSLRIDRYAPFKGRAVDVDVVQDLMIHDIDLLLWLTQKKIVSVKAWGHKIRTRHWDHVTAHFILQDGSHALITVGRNHVEEVRALEVMGAAGMLKVDLLRNKILRAPQNQVAEGVFVEERDYPKRDHLLLEQQAFYHSILNRSPVMVSGEEGRDAIFYLEKVLLALDSQKTESCHG